MKIDPHMFDHPDPNRTLGLRAGNGTTFWVDGHELASKSRIFKTAFDQQLADPRILTLQNAKAEDILELLLCIIPWPNLKPIDHSNLGLMLDFADFFEIYVLRTCAESFLLNDLDRHEQGSDALLVILYIAAQYRLRSVLDPCLKRCAWEFPIEKLESAFADSHKSIVDCLHLYKNTRSIPHWRKIDERARCFCSQSIDLLGNAKVAGCILVHLAPCMRIMNLRVMDVRSKRDNCTEFRAFVKVLLDNMR